MDVLMLSKILGAALILTSGTLMGFAFSQIYKDRVLFLEDFNKRLNVLQNEIGFMKGVIGDCMKNASDGEGNSGRLFLSASQYIHSMEASEAWNKACDEILPHYNLLAEQEKPIRNLGRLLGASDVDGELSNIKICISDLSEVINKAREQKEKNEPLFKKAGPIMALAIVVMLL